MELKKVKHKDTRTYRALFFFIGMTVSVGTVYAIMEYRKYDKVAMNNLEIVWEEEDFIIEQTAYKKPPPPPQEPIKDFILKLVPDDKTIEDIEIDLDVEPDDDPNPDAPDLGDDTDDGLEETGEPFHWTQVQEPASFPGGKSAMDEFINENLNLSDFALEEAESGTVAISFTIEKDGSLSDIRVTSKRKIGYGVEESVLEVFKKMPKWKPALQRDKPARMSFTKPVRLNLN
jgi:protein TonB